MSKRKIPEGVDPKALQTILLDEISGKLSDLKETIELGYTSGEMENTTIVVGTDGYMLRPTSPLFSVSIFNDGPNPVYLSINYSRKITSADPPLNVGESIDIQKKKAQIERIYFQTLVGQATLRLFGGR